MGAQSRLSRLFNIRHPLFLAPMTGGPSTPALAVAVSQAGGLGSLGLGHMKENDVRRAIREVKAGTDAPFGVNLFVPGPFEVDMDKVMWARQVIKDAGYEAPTDLDPSNIGVPFDEQAQVVIEEKVPVVSFTFGLPSSEWLDRFRASGAVLVGTATTVEEARRVRDAGLQAVVAQGYEAGGHRGTFLGPAEDGLIGTFALVPQVVDAVGGDVAVIAAGGVMDGRGITAALALGADGVQMGTAFLATEECGASKIYKDVLLSLGRDRPTSLTTVFSGKLARGIRNSFMMHQQLPGAADKVPDFPVMNYLSKPMRIKASGDDTADWERLSLWAGQGFTMQSNKRRKAGQLVQDLVREAEEVMHRISSSSS